ncbi:IS701 family transposase [Streptomyces parvus]|uniref:IS701 family transposase n=1 Tax=Streptomyces parvus TaxID=66428 RepID=UPI0037F595CD
MATIKDQVAAEATMAEREWTNVIGAAMAGVANCSARREPRLPAREMCEAMLMELDTRNCWTLAEALGHCGPHRLQHFLARARIDRDPARDGLAAWVTSELADDQAVLVVDETGDEKSSGDAVGAAHRYSGALGGVGLCQVAVHLTYASRRGHAMIDRELYLPAAWAADEERRLLAHVPGEREFATKPQLAADMLERARARGVRARRLAGDEVYGGRELRLPARRMGFDYAMAVKTDRRVTTSAGTFTAAELADPGPTRPDQPPRTAPPAAGHRAAFASPQPRSPCCTGPPGAANTSTVRPKQTAAGTTSPPPRRHDTTRLVKNYSCRFGELAVRLIGRFW